MREIRFTSLILLVAGALVLGVACRSESPAEEVQAVELTITAAPDLVAHGASFVVRRADGRNLYKGTLEDEDPIVVDLELPTTEDHVDITLVTESRTTRSTVTIRDGYASKSFR